MIKVNSNLFYPLLVSFVIGLYFVSPPQGEYWWSDESRHAMDGVFFFDFFRDLPFDHLRSYLEEYIVRYPALSFTWNLPFFALASSPFFALFGVNVFTAQMVVLGFACILSIAMYEWGKEFVSPIVAVLAVILFFLNDTVLLWMRSVMLELPALCMMFLFALSFKAYIRSPSYKWAFLAGCIGFSMLMTKQVTLFILPVMLVYAWYNRKLFTLWDKRSWPAYLLILLGMIVIVIHALTIGQSGFSAIANSSSSFLQIFIFEKIPLMLKVVYQVFSWPLLSIFFISITVGLISGEIRKIALLLSWVIFGFLFISFLTGIETDMSRYCIYIAPPMYLLALLAMSLYPKGSLQNNAVTSIFIGILAWSAWVGMTQTQPYLQGYKQIAKYVHELPDNSPVMFCCDHDGNYIFSMRELDNQRKTITLRADKMLVSIVVYPDRGVVSHTSNQDEIIKLLDSYGVRYLVLEEGTYSEVEEFEMLRKIVQGENFEKLKTFTTSSGDGSYKNWAYDDGIIVNVYRNLNARDIKNNTISIPLPRFGREIEVVIK